MSNRETAEGRLLVIAAPSGAGKTTLVHELVKRNDRLKFSISYTTRKQRKTEVDGRDYFFVDEARFFALRDEGELLESAEVFGNYYGTSRSQVEDHLANQRNVILEIDWQGAQQVRESMPECITVFILPPSRPELERRLRDRQTDADEVIARRLADALGDMSHWNEFEYVIINEEIETAVAALEDILHGGGEDCRVSRPELAKRVKKILV